MHPARRRGFESLRLHGKRGFVAGRSGSVISREERAQALPAALAHPNVGEENPRRRPVPVLTHGSSFPSLSAEVRTGGVEPPQHEATGLQPAELTDAQRPQRGVADRARTGASGLTLPDAAATPRPPRSGDDRRRTGDLSPDKRVLSQLSYVPAAPRPDSSARRRKGPLTPSCTGRLVRRRAAGSCCRAGGSSPPRVAADAAASDWRGWDSNPRSRAHEAREDSRSSTAQSGRQESNLRSPAPEAGGVTKLPYDQMDQHPRRGSNPQLPG